MHIIRCTLNFGKLHEVSCLSLIVNHLFVTLRLVFVFGLPFWLGLGLMFMSLEGLWLGGHFMTFIVRISRQKC